MSTQLTDDELSAIANASDQEVNIDTHLGLLHCIRKAIEAYEAKQLGESATYVHKKTGGVYTIVALGSLESTGELMVVYRGKTGTWIRPEAEFFDGRFEAIDSAKTKDTTK